MDSNRTVIKVSELSVGYEDTTILKDVSFKLDEGEVVFVIGQNGSGKSTLLKTIGGMLAPKSGKILLNEKPITNIAADRIADQGLSFLVQGGLIMPELTVYEHLKLAQLTVKGKLGKTEIDNTFEVFEALKNLQNKRAGNLSGGERQMLSFAMLHIQQSKVWLLDEPTAGLSPKMVSYTVDLLSRVNKLDGVAMLIVEHNMAVALKLAQRIIIAKNNTITSSYNRSDFQESHLLTDLVYN